MPDKCPICGADSSHIKEVKSKGKGINTNSNVYTVVYASVMVIIVGQDRRKRYERTDSYRSGL